MNNLELDQSDKIGPLEQMAPAKIRAAALAVCDLTGDATVARVMRHHADQIERGE